MDRSERIVTVGLLTDSDLTRLRLLFTLVWPIDETPCFNGLLQAIDEADRRLRKSGKLRDTPV